MSVQCSEEVHSQSFDFSIKLPAFILDSDVQQPSVSAPESSVQTPRSFFPKMNFLNSEEFSEISTFPQTQFLFRSMMATGGDPNYKTEICKNFSTFGNCKFESACCFAHGNHELRPKKLSGTFKSKFCNKFNTHSWCNYGSRCQFIHSFSYQTALQNLVDKSASMISEFPKVSLLVLMGQLKSANKPLAIFQRFQRFNS